MVTPVCTKNFQLRLRKRRACAVHFVFWRTNPSQVYKCSQADKKLRYTGKQDRIAREFGVVIADELLSLPHATIR
jgi:hypothetical protein